MFIGQKKLVLSIGIFILVFLTGIFTCANAQTTPKPTPAVRKPMGTLTVALGSFGNEYWPGAAGATDPYQILGQVVQTLLYGKLDGTVGPGLAEKWNFSPDMRSLILDLRKGIQFHEGWGEFTAEDVKFAFELAQRKGVMNQKSSYFRDTIRDVEIVNPYRVVIHMKRPSWMMEYFISDPVPWLVITSKKYVKTVGEEQAAKHPIGTGPWRFAEHKLGNYIKLEAVENHWQQTPYLKTVILKLVPEEVSRVAMLKTGAADVIEIGSQSVLEVKAAGMKIRSIPSIIQVLCLFGQYRPEQGGYDPTVPWALPDRVRALKVRKALAWAINKQEIIDHVLLGYGELCANYPFYPFTPGFDPAWKPYPYDPNGAKSLLADAGYPDPSKIKVELLLTPQPGRASNVPIIEAIGLYWEKIGITVNYSKIDYVTLQSRTISRKAAGSAWVYPARFYEEIAAARGSLHPDEGVGYVPTNTPYVAEMLDKLDAEMDKAKRAVMSRELGQYIYDNYLVIPIAYSSAIWGINPKIVEWPAWPSFGFTTQHLAYLKLNIHK